MPKPVVALVGRPNVGKSTLFNRLVGDRVAVVDDVPGTTRDRLLAEAEWTGTIFDVMDTGGIDPTSGAGGEKTPLSVGSAPFVEQIRLQAEMAVQEADAVLFIVDAHAGVTPADQEVANILRRMQSERDGQPYPPILLVANKCDDIRHDELIYAFYELGMGDPFPISAMHGTGTGDLLDALVAVFRKFGTADEDDSIKIAIVGKPNAGKSTLLNRLLGYERVIVSPIPGTTRDAIDTHLRYNDIDITLIDTAGIRRRGRIEPGVEKYSVMRALQAVERADVVLLVVDAVAGITAQDAHIAGYVLEYWKSVVVVVNKWDAIVKDTHTMGEMTKKIRQELNFLDYVPLIYISAQTGQRVDQVLSTALRVQEERITRMPTSQLNQVIHKAQDYHAPSTSGRGLKIFYGTQVRTDPPTFMLYVNDPKLAHFTYLRFLENRLREVYPYEGTPIRFVLKSRRDT